MMSTPTVVPLRQIPRFEVWWNRGVCILTLVVMTPVFAVWGAIGGIKTYCWNLLTGLWRCWGYCEQTHRPFQRFMRD